MPTFFSFIPAYVLNAIIHYKYLILFPILVIEGPIATIVSGALASPSFHEFNILFLYFFVLFADIFGDTMYYSIGRFAGPKIILKFKKWRGVTENYEERVKSFFEKYGNVAIFLGKITHGIGWPIMLAAGSVRMPYFRFISYCTAVSIFKTALLLAIGYYYEKDYSIIAYYIGSAGTEFLTLVVVAIVLARTFLKKDK
ncbi:MAG: VTT domain-containing protein [bacterium]